MVCGDIPQLPVINCTFTPSEEDLVETKVYTVKDYDACMTYLKSTIPEEELTDEILNQADSVCKGNGIPEDGESTSIIFEVMISGSTEIEQELIDLNVINVEISSDLKTGTKYAHGQYTYTYNVAFYGQYNYSTYIDGWSVKLTDKDSTDQVTSEVCTYINNKPIVSMSGMFERSNATIVDLSSFNTSNVTDMRNMFSMSAITRLDLSNFNTSKVTNMSSMFSNSEVISLDLSSFDTSNVTDMSSMFSWSEVTSLDLSGFDTSNVTDMHGMFQNSAATSINLSSFDTSNVVTMYSMFAGSKATSLDLSSFDTSNVTDMIEMFKGSAATSLDLSSFDTSNVIYMWSMFQNSAATSLDLSSFDTSNVTDMSYMFQNSSATTGYARTQVDADKFNSSSNKPSTLTFVVKGS